MGNQQKAFEYINPEDELFNHLMIVANFQFGYKISNEQIDFLETDSKHNLAIINNFGIVEKNISIQDLQSLYEEAIKSGKTNAEKLFSTKNYVNLLMDNGLHNDAEKLMRSMMSLAKNKDEKNALNVLLANCLMAQINIPYNKETLSEIETLQTSAIAYFQENELKLNAGLVLINAAELANIQEDFQKANNLINKALLFFKDENIPQFMGEASYQKAIILYKWSKNGSPQYYKPSINTFQNALKVFKENDFPQKFADIHHNLALIYSEIQVSEQEKPIWTAFCASSFKNALKFYTKEEHPYQFAMISHNYATALMGFPEAKLHSNLDKAFGFFEDALAIRNKENYPFERALTLLNQLELYWLIHNENYEDEIKTFEAMNAKANEIKELVKDKDLIEKANTHIEELHKIKKTIF
ncbi:MAG: hypothetical protein HF967_05460 [Methanosarcinales archaeon]|nr:hypothetical protein [Methanosarcinales archaeon]